jgi:hypothetical protein
MDLQPLYDLIDALQAEREVIDERLRLAAELLNTFDPTDADIVIPLEDVEVALVGVPKAPTKPASQPSEKVACPDCGKLYHAQGMGVHRSRAHPGSAAKPVQLEPARKPADRDPLDDFGDEAFVCTSCNHEEPNLNGMKRHTLAMHGRPVNDLERDSVAA